MANGSMSVSVAPSDCVHKGQVVTIQNTLSVGGTNTASTGITMKLLDPSGNTDTYTSSNMSSTSTGIYIIDVVADEEGIFQYYWTSTNTAQAAASGQFTVLDTPFN